MNIQELIVLALVALAGAFLAWRVAGPFVGGSASTGCHDCSAPCELKTADISRHAQDVADASCGQRGQSRSSRDRTS